MPEEDKKVVDMTGREHVQPPVTDFWFAQVDTRLSRIEMFVMKLEWQVLIVVCAVAAVFVLQLISVLKG